MTKKNNIFFMLNLQIGQRVQTTHAGATNLFYFIFFANQNRHQQTNNWKKWSHLIEQKKIFIMILAFALACVVERMCTEGFIVWIEYSIFEKNKINQIISKRDCLKWKVWPRPRPSYLLMFINKYTRLYSKMQRYKPEMNRGRMNVSYNYWVEQT